MGWAGIITWATAANTHPDLCTKQTAGTGIWDYQKGVLSHQKIKSNGTNDVVFVNVGEYVTLRTKYEDFSGRPMQHCHLLFHEDFGMMAP